MDLFLCFDKAWECDDQVKIGQSSTRHNRLNPA